MSLTRAAVLVRRDGPPVAALAALTGVQLWPAAGPGRLPESLDLMLQYVPNAAYLARSLAELQVPLWNPYLGAGMPFAADPGAGAWYVPNWPALLALSLFGAVRLGLWLHVLWAALGTYTYCRAILRVAPGPALLAGVAFSLTSWLPGLAGMPAVLTSTSWLPWIVVAGTLAAERGGRWIAALALASALQAVSGWPAGAYLSWLALGVLTLLRHPSGRSIARLAAGAATAVLLAGVLLVPAGEFVRETSYAATRPLDAVAHDGYLTLLSWLRPAGGTGSLESSQLYAGVATIVLALAGALWGRRRDAWPLAALAVLAIVLAAGIHGPLFAPLYQWLPGFRIVYLPARLGMVAAFAFAALAALGLARVAGGLSRRQYVAVAAGAVALAPLVVVQFWHAEGYDDFRRLLTNVGRFTGGPFLSRAQQAQYVLVALGAMAALFLATTKWRRIAAPLLLSVAVADALAAHQLARPAGFEPAAWYAPALRTADELRPLLGDERVAGSQWHGTQHFLSRFPHSANPALLPPNLSLLAGVRDAQAYNPLLLRRAAAYFAEINYQHTGTLEPDDHWLWIMRFPGDLVDRLAIRYALAGGAEWRVRSTRVIGPHALAPGGQPVRNSLAPLSQPPAATRLHVVTYLGEGVRLAQGTPVAAVTLAAVDGTVERHVLRAGEHTAEWAYGRPDVRATVQHSQAPIALETQLVGAVGGRYSVYEYVATFAVEPAAGLASIELAPLLPAGSAVLHVTGAWLELPGTYEAAASPSGIVGLRKSAARPRLSTAAGEGRIVAEAAERIEVRVTSSGGTAVMLADSFYPGWVARLDGQRVPIRPTWDLAERGDHPAALFRAVDVPGGEHALVFTYEPASLRLGLVATATGAALWLALLTGRPHLRRAA